MTTTDHKCYLILLYYLAKPTAVPTWVAGIACKYPVAIGLTSHVVIQRVMKGSLLQRIA